MVLLSKYLCSNDVTCQKLLHCLTSHLQAAAELFRPAVLTYYTARTT